MLVSHRKQFIFTKTQKTAGTSVESYFEKYCMPEGEWKESHARAQYESETGIIGRRGRMGRRSRWFHHMPASRIRKQLGTDTWDYYFKFTVVRNPYDKLISGFQHKLRSNKIRIPVGRDEIETFRRWIKSGEAIMDRDRYLIDGEICMDYFIRYETLNQDIEHVCNRLSVPFSAADIPEFKKGHRNHQIPIQSYYDKATIEIVKRMYDWELEHFKYDFPT